MMAIRFYTEVLRIRLHALKEEKKRKYLLCSTGFKHRELKNPSTKLYATSNN